MEGTRGVDGDLAVILQDDIDSRVQAHSSDMLSYFPYENTKVINIGMKSELMEEFMANWLGDIRVYPENNSHLIQALESLILILQFNVSYFVVVWDSFQDMSLISLVIHGNGNVYNDDLIQVVDTEESKQLIQAGENTKLERFDYQTISYRNEFKSLLQSMCVSANLIMTDTDWLWPFYGWSQPLTISHNQH